MDINRFDSLVRTLSAGDSRRGAIRALAASGLAVGLTRLGLDRTDAKKKKKKLGQTCKKSKQCQGSLVCQPTNSQNSCYDTTVKRCCKKLGERCDDGCECCGVDVICNGHICQSA